MQQYINSAKVKRNARIARILSFGGLAVMGIGLLISFRSPYRIDLVLGLFLVGILGSQIGLPMRNRWDRRPRIDEILDAALKGLDQRFAIFHYSLGARHVLVCPGGVFAVIPRVENGLISYSDGSWTRTTNKRGLLRRGGDEIDTWHRGRDFLRSRSSRLSSQPAFAVRPFIVFLHAGAEMDIRESPELATHLKKLKASLRKLPKAQTLSEQQIKQLVADGGFS